MTTITCVRKVVTGILVNIALLLNASSALAHAFIEHTDPRVGSAVAVAPASVTIWFTQDLEPAFSTIAVTDLGGARVDLGDTHVSTNPSRLQVGLRRLPPGKYTVRWRVVSVDTHSSQGRFMFVVTGR